MHQVWLNNEHWILKHRVKHFYGSNFASSNSSDAKSLFICKSDSSVFAWVCWVNSLPVRNCILSMKLFVHERPTFLLANCTSFVVFDRLESFTALNYVERNCVIASMNKSNVGAMRLLWKAHGIFKYSFISKCLSLELFIYFLSKHSELSDGIRSIFKLLNALYRISILRRCFSLTSFMGFTKYLSLIQAYFRLFY